MQVDFRTKELLARARLSIAEAAAEMRDAGIDIGNTKLSLFIHGNAAWPVELRKKVSAWIEVRARLPGAEKKILEPRTDIARRCRDLGHSIQDLADLIDDRDNPFCCAVVVGLREPPNGFDLACRNVFKIWTAERGDQGPAIGATSEGGA